MAKSVKGQTGTPVNIFPLYTNLMIRVMSEVRLTPILGPLS